MPGETNLYSKARRILLDALQALRPHLDSVILVGAQAIYLRTGEEGIAVAPYTNDADLALEPRTLGETPPIEEAMIRNGFLPGDQPGSWLKENVPVDLLVPESLAGPGRRAASLGTHGKNVARKVRGLEGALIDKDEQEIGPWESNEGDRFRLHVAGPGALLVAKLHKIAERIGDHRRQQDKDALDVLRLLRRISRTQMVRRLNLLLKTDLSRNVTRVAIHQLRELFGKADALGSLSAARALDPLEAPVTVTASCEALTGEILSGGLDLPDL